MIARITDARSTALIALVAVVDVVVIAAADDSVRVTMLLIILAALVAISPAALMTSPVVPPTASPIPSNPSAISPSVLSNRCHFLIALSLGANFVLEAALSTALMVAGPILIIALVIGLLVSVFQAATQIQEQTLTFVPKLIAIATILLVGGSWMLNKLVVFTNEIMNIIANVKG